MVNHYTALVPLDHFSLKVKRFELFTAFPEPLPPPPPMQRTWTDETRDAWQARRTARRKQLGLPRPAEPRAASLERERAKTRETLRELVQKTAVWEVRCTQLCARSL